MLVTVSPLYTAGTVHLPDQNLTRSVAYKVSPETDALLDATMHEDQGLMCRSLLNQSEDLA